MDERDRRQRLAAVWAAMSNADEETLRNWRADTKTWEALDDDLDGYA
ncbi:hypothetical protein SKC41_20785 [Mycobacterium sp. 050128]